MLQAGYGMIVSNLKRNVQNFDVAPPWKNFCGRPRLHWFRSKPWVIKCGTVWFNSFKSLKNDKCQSCQVPYLSKRTRPNQKAPQFWHVVNSLKTWKSSKGMFWFWYSSARLRAFARFAQWLIQPWGLWPGYEGHARCNLYWKEGAIGMIRCEK